VSHLSFSVHGSGSRKACQYRSPLHERINNWIPPAYAIEPSWEKITPENKLSLTGRSFHVCARPTAVTLIMQINRTNPAFDQIYRKMLVHDIFHQQGVILRYNLFVDDVIMMVSPGLWKLMIKTDRQRCHAPLRCIY
jgi:hypothetical protein